MTLNFFRQKKRVNKSDIMATTIGIGTCQNQTPYAEKATDANRENEKSIVTLLVTILKKAALINAIYFIGYFNWSVAWIITPMILVETQKYWRGNSENSKFVRKIATLSAATNEKDAILANIKDLPSWVYGDCLFLTIYVL